MTGSKRILLVDDEVSIQRAMAPFLRSPDCAVSVAGSGAEAMRSIEVDAPDLIVLDLGLPDIDGTEVCRRIREERSTPIIILSARDSEADKVAALEAGANDYITKRSTPEDLRARIQAWLHPAPVESMSEGRSITIGDLAIDYESRHVFLDNQEIELTPKEFDLLTFLARHRDTMLTNATISNGIGEPNSDRLWAIVSQLRKKIEPDPSHPRYIISEPWVGYRLITQVQRQTK
jgi:two-component system, OmpR family, KDP operon response regulator KdpE